MTWVSYAQNYEDVTLLRALGDVASGFYIDVGANDPRVDSVTRAFYERGWHGINIEPVPHWHERLRSDRPRDLNLRVAAGPNLGTMRLHEVVGTGLSTADPRLAQRHARQGREVRSFEVPVRRLDDICEEFAVQEVHFLKVDVEGAEPGVLQGMALTRLRPWIIVVEAVRPGTQSASHLPWEPLLTARGYRLAWSDGLNRFYVAQEHARLQAALAQPPSVFDDFIRYGEHLLRADVSDYRELLQIERARVDDAQARVTALMSSRSWRITAPLRRVGELARRLRARFAAIPSRRPDPALIPVDDSSRAPASAASRPRLAVVSPLPPLRSGVADYCARLLPGLADHYAIEVVTEQEQTSDAWVARHCMLRKPAWFDENAGRYDRIVYHVGNSLLHAGMLDLLSRHPGTVVLHDLALSDLLEHLERTGARPDAFRRALLLSHGWPALRDAGLRGAQAAVRAWPASAEVFEAADGVILTSAFAAAWAASMYGPRDAIVAVPLPRGLEPMPDRQGARLSARARLGLAPEAFVVCSFGFVDRSKQSARLLAVWEGGALGLDSSAVLVFVGENEPGEYGRLMAASVAGMRAGAARITGYVDPEAYGDWLAAADVAVQLRCETRGESSGALLDCMAAELAIVVNAHGPQGELPAHCVVRLEDRFGDAELREALELLRAQPARRAELAQAAVDHLRVAHDPSRVAARHAEAIEAFHRRVSSEEAAPCQGPRQLLVDVTALAVHDLRSGVQRVVRSVLNIIARSPIEGLRVEPVFLDRGCYWHARRFSAALFDAGPPPCPDEPVVVRAGDIFLGLDLVTHGVHLHQALFEAWRAQGVIVHFVVYDLLPVQHPDWFPPEDRAHFRQWLHTVCSVADSLLCISRATAETLLGLLPRFAGAGAARPAVSWFHLGADLPASLPSSGLAPAERAWLDRQPPTRAMLTVGTVEPRKGVGQALAAFERLWAADAKVEWWIVGRPGWMVESLVERLRAHPEAGRRLHWFESASDELLQHLYRKASALLMASEGEGFGLPLIEAAQHGLPLLVRDLPVFREVAGRHAAYWDGDDEALAGAIARWIEQNERGLTPDSGGLPGLDWQQSCDQLMRVVLGRNLARPLGVQA